MKRNIIVAHKAISSDLCNSIINITKNSFQPAMMAGTGDGYKNPTQRRSETSWLGGSLRHLDVYTPLLQLINKVNKDFYGFDLTDPDHLLEKSGITVALVESNHLNLIQNVFPLYQTNLLALQ